MNLRVLLAAIAASFLLAAATDCPTYAQARNSEVDRSPAIARTLPLKKFYNTPNPLPAGRPGDLIRSQETDEYDLPFHVLAVRILYHSRSASGEDVAVSGVVLYPDAKPPAGGWPVIAWAHALNGVARQCAPSLARNLQHGPFLSMYVNLGYAVVATDYAGLGSKFRNAFLDIPSNAADVIYSVPAARAAVPQLNFRWIAIGVREGGPVVIGTAELEHEIHDQNFLGSIAISGLDDLEDHYELSSAPSFYPMPLFLAYGIKTVYPEFDVKDILTDKALAMYARVEQTCSEPVGELRVSPAEMVKPSWASNKFVKQYFNRNTPGQKPAQGPMLVISSELDPTVPIQRTAQVIARLCNQGDPVQFERYPQSEPSRVFGDSVRDQIGWIQARFSGRPTANICAKR